MSHKLLSSFENTRIFSSKNFEIVKQISPGSIIQAKIKSPGASKPQNYIGICIALKKKGISTSLLLRNFISGEAIEYRIYPYSINVEGLSILSYAKLNHNYRRAKLYYLRERTPKESTVTLK